MDFECLENVAELFIRQPCGWSIKLCQLNWHARSRIILIQSMLCWNELINTNKFFQKMSAIFVIFQIVVVRRATKSLVLVTSSTYWSFLAAGKNWKRMSTIIIIKEDSIFRHSNFSLSKQTGKCDLHTDRITSRDIFLSVQTGKCDLHTDCMTSRDIFLSLQTNKQVNVTFTVNA